MESVDEPRLDDDPVAEAFFSAPPPPVEIHAHDWGPPRPLDPAHRRAMHATWLMLVGSALGLGGFVVHQKWIMPAPVELRASAPEIHWTVQDAPLAAAAPAPTRGPLSAHPPLTAARPAQTTLPAEAPSSPAEVSARVGASGVGPAPAGAARAAAHGAVPGRHVERQSGPAARPREASSRPRDAELERALKQAHAALRHGNARLARGHAVNALALDAARADAYIALGAARAALGDTVGAQQAYGLCAARAMGPRVAACRALLR